MQRRQISKFKNKYFFFMIKNKYFKKKKNKLVQQKRNKEIKQINDHNVAAEKI